MIFPIRIFKRGEDDSREDNTISFSNSVLYYLSNSLHDDMYSTNKNLNCFRSVLTTV